MNILLNNLKNITINIIFYEAKSSNKNYKDKFLIFALIFVGTLILVRNLDSNY